MKEKIIKLLGENHITPISFNSTKDFTEVYGLYTYQGEVCVLREGLDLDFDSLTLMEQKKVLEMVESKNWKLDKTLQ